MYSLFKITDRFAAPSSGNFAYDVFHTAPQVIDVFRVIYVYIFLAISQKEKNPVGLDKGIGLPTRNSSLWMFSDARADFGFPIRSSPLIVPVSLNILCVATTEFEAINS